MAATSAVRAGLCHHTQMLSVLSCSFYGRDTVIFSMGTENTGQGGLLLPNRVYESFTQVAPALCQGALETELWLLKLSPSYNREHLNRESKLCVTTAQISRQECVFLCGAASSRWVFGQTLGWVRQSMAVLTLIIFISS